MRKIPGITELNALTITFFYLIFGVLWILLSDQLLQWLIGDTETLSYFQTIKGFLYVMITGLMLFFLIQRSNEKIVSEKSFVNDALERVNMAAWSVNLKTRKSIPSEGDYKLFGYSTAPKNWGLHKFLNAIHPDDSQRVEQLFNDAVKNDTPYNVKYRIIWPNGEIHWMHSRGAIKKEEGNPAYMIGIVADITKQKELEDRYQKEKEVFEQIFNTIPVLITIYDPEVKTLQVNRAFEDVLGWTNEDLSKHFNPLNELYPDKKKRKRALEAMKKADKSWHEFEILTKQKEKRLQRWANIRLSDETTIGIGLDITEQRLLEQKLEEEREELLKSNNRYKKAEEIANIGYWERDITTGETVWSAGAYKLFGVNPDKTSASYELLLDIIHPDDRAAFIKAQKEALKTGVLDIHFRIVRKSGEIVFLYGGGEVIKNEAGESVFISGFIQDLTELQESRQRYKKAEQIAGIGHWQRNLQTGEAIWSDGFYNIIELEKGTKGTDFASLLSMIIPEDREPFEKAFNEAKKTGKFDFQYRLVKQRSGKIGHYHELAEVEYGDHGQPLYIHGTIQEITANKIYQAQIQESQRLMRRTFESLEESVVILEYKTRTIMDCNPSTERMFGYTKYDLIGSSTEILHVDEEHYKIFQKLSEKDLNRKGFFHTEFKMKKKDGEIFYSDHTVSLVYDDNNEIDRIVSVVRDITEVKEAQLELRDSEQKYWLLFQQNPQPMWIFDPETLKFLEVNKAAIHHYGYSEEEFLSMTIADIRPENEIPNLQKTVSTISFKESPSYHQEWIHRKKDGSIIHVMVSASRIRYGNKITRVVLVNDITEQKKAEERVIASLIEGENRERKRLAQELHDGLGQYLAAATMNFDSIDDFGTELSQKKVNRLQKGINFLKHAVIETRRMSHNLMPRVVEDYGLPHALEALVDGYRKSTDIAFYYFQNLGDTILNDEIAINIYRIAQEALSNAVKYSEADKINLQLIKDGSDLILTIDDNGKGFNREAPDFKKGLGLQTIKTRTDVMGGVLDIETKPGKGTFLNIITPL